MNKAETVKPNTGIFIGTVLLAFMVAVGVVTGIYGLVTKPEEKPFNFEDRILVMDNKE